MANPNWTRWVFASVARYFKDLATANHLNVLVEGLDDRTTEYMDKSDRAEVRVTGPHTKEHSAGDYTLWADINVLITSRMESGGKNRYEILRYAGLFHEAMDKPIPIFKFGNGADDNKDVQIGCLELRSGKNDMVRVMHFGQIDPSVALKQSMVDARYVMTISE